MQIIIDEDVFDVQSSEEGVALAHLFITMVRDVYAHGVITAPVPGGAPGVVEHWLDSRPALESAPFRSMLTNGLLHARVARNPVIRDRNNPPRFYLPGPLQIRIERRTTSDWKDRRLTVVDAADLLQEPVHWVVENRRADTNFVLHLADPTNRAILEQCLTSPSRIQKIGGGSGEIRAWLDELLAGSLTPDKWRRVLRGWVLFDRDAGNLDARNPSQHALDLMELCEKIVSRYGPGLSWNCLGRREIESYVPNSGLVAEATGRQTIFVQHVIAWRARKDREDWAWAMDLKNGFHGDLQAGLSDTDRAAINKDTLPLQPHLLKAPFNGCSTAEVDEMKRGLGKKLGKRLLDAGGPPAWALDFAMEYDRGPADQVARAMFVQSLFDRM